MPAINPQPLIPGHLGGKGTSLLGDAPQPLMGANVGAANVNASIMQAMGLNVGTGSSTGSAGQSLLSQISQGLVHQIGQNLLYQMSVGQGGNTSSGKGLLGDIPSDGHSRFKGTGQKSSLLGEPPAHVKSTPLLSSSHTSVDQGSWKSMETRYGIYPNIHMNFTIQLFSFIKYSSIACDDLTLVTFFLFFFVRKKTEMSYENMNQMDR